MGKIRGGKSLPEVFRISRSGFHGWVCSHCNITTVGSRKKVRRTDWSGREPTSETVSGASVPIAEKTDVNTQTSGVKEPAGFCRKKLTLPDFERTFFSPVDCRNRSAIYVSVQTKCKVSEILHLLGNESTRLTALVDNMLRFVIGIYSDELNYLHEKKNKRPF